MRALYRGWLHEAVFRGVSSLRQNRRALLCAAVRALTAPHFAAPWIVSVWKPLRSGLPALAGSA